MSALPDSLHRRVVRHGCDLLGIDQLADRLDVSRAEVDSWLAGTAIPAPRAFLRIIRLLRVMDPTYRPVPRS